VKNILILAPKSYYACNLIKYLNKKKIKLFIIFRKKQDIKILRKKYNKFNFKTISLVNLLNNKIDLKKYRIDIVINTINKYQKEKYPYLEIYNSNVSVPSKIFKLIHKSKIKYFINVDTVLNEKTNFYALTKFIFRTFIKNYNLNNKVKFINLRYHNFYSYNSYDRNIISKLINNSKKNKEINLTKGSQIRDFIHIDDAVFLAIKIIENINKFNNIQSLDFNIGGNQHMSIKYLTDLIRNFYCSNKKLNNRTLPYNNKYEKINYFSDNKIISKIVNWTPRDKIIDYFKKS